MEAIIPIHTPPVRRDDVELLDDPRAVLPALSGNLREIRRLNHWFGGTKCVLFHIQKLVDPDGRVTLLDVATGSGEIPLAAVQRARTEDIRLDAVGLDVSREILAEARHTVGGAVALVHGDARSLPWPENSFDIVMCNLAIHHFAPSEVQQVLTEMWRVTRRAVLVTDLVRGYPAYVGTWLATHLLCHNRLTRHDGPLSVLRAYTPQELRALAEEAGWQHITMQHHSFFRQALIAQKVPDRD